MTLDSEKCYYAIIPADVRYDESLIPSAKLLYGEITALCNAKGYCWATNDYFSRLYSVNKKTISRWIKSLSDKGYITLRLVRNNDEKQSVTRLIKISEPRTKMSIPSEQKCPYPQDKNVSENNTMNNTINNISSSQIFGGESPQTIRAQSFAENSSNLPAKQISEGSKLDNSRRREGAGLNPASDPYLLARFLERCIAENNPKFPQSESQRQRWAKDFDLMIRRDKIEADDIAEVIEWSQKDNFWRSNILSGKKVPDKYQQLRMRIESR